jgi:hypothetical protein
MKKFTLPLYIILSFFTGSDLFSQDTLAGKLMVERDSTDQFGCINFYQRGNEDAKLTMGGYISTYYAYYTDETENNGFVQIPVMAPRNKEFGLNIIQLSMQYNSKNVRGKFGLHFGDIPKAIWPTELNMVQEAHGGVRVLKKFWMDAGVFRSHIGIESIQPRENITSSTSLVNNYEPYYFTGVKLTYVLNSKLSLQVNAFNSFNTLVDNNDDKLFGFSAVYDPGKNTSITYNFLTGDETPDTVSRKHRRYYNNIYATIIINKFTLALEANYGWQENSVIGDSTGTAGFYSGLATIKYQPVKKAYLYLRGEYLSDPNAVITGNLNFGENVMGTTLGMELKPYKNISLSLEGRILQSDKQVFREKNYITNQRLEGIICLDVSF